MGLKQLGIMLTLAAALAVVAAVPYPTNQEEEVNLQHAAAELQTQIIAQSQDNMGEEVQIQGADAQQQLLENLMMAHLVANIEKAANQAVDENQDMDDVEAQKYNLREILRYIFKHGGSALARGLKKITPEVERINKEFEKLKDNEHLNNAVRHTNNGMNVLQKVTNWAGSLFGKK